MSSRLPEPLAEAIGAGARVWSLFFLFTFSPAKEIPWWFQDLPCCVCPFALLLPISPKKVEREYGNGGRLEEGRD